MNQGFNDRDGRNSKYRKKYKYLKKRIKSLIIVSCCRIRYLKFQFNVIIFLYFCFQENAALCDEVAKIQESILIVKDERKFLLRKLIEYENMTENSNSVPKISTTNPSVNGSKVKKRRSPEHAAKNMTQLHNV